MDKSIISIKKLRKISFLRIVINDFDYGGHLIYNIDPI